jgi:phosphate acetyltransferase
VSTYHDHLVERCRALPPIRTAIVYPCDALALESALVAGAAGLIVPVLIGNAREISDLACAKRLDIDGCELISVEDSHEAAARAVELARTGKVEALMKGSLHSDELLHAIASPDSGLHTSRRLSHAYVMDLPTHPQPLLISDAVVNITPSLDEKRDIVQNVVDLAHALGITQPRVALLSAIETVSSKVASTVEASALCKMADRMQITGAVLDGPLALDDAISAQVSSEKHIVSPVAGRANVLVVPDFESGNILAKTLIHLARASAAGVVLGATVPIAFTSRADDIMTHVASIAIARLLVAASVSRCAHSSP